MSAAATRSVDEPKGLPAGSGPLAATLVLAPPLGGLLWLSGAMAPFVGNLVAAQGLQPGLVTMDLAIQLVSLTGMPAYVTRPFIDVGWGGRRKDVALERYAALARVADEETSAAFACLREVGIEWYVVAGKPDPRWDPQRRHAAYVNRTVAVYSTYPTLAMR